MIKVLVVDDSVFMRKLLTDLFAGETDFTVVDTARNGKDAIDKVKRFKPDLITMDVEMPVMDGIKALELIMKEAPTPVVMISSLTQAGAVATLRALEIGAVDFVAKTAGPISNITAIRTEILTKCRAAVRANVLQLATGRATAGALPAMPKMHSPPGLALDERIVAIGTSTGGPRALQEIITKIPGNIPCGIVIVQHMPPGFTKSLAERLDSLSSVTVKEAEHNDVIRPGYVFIAPGDYHMLIEREGGKTVIKLNQNPPIGGHRPAVDPLMESVARTYGSKAIGVILTGMGRDGAKGIEAIKRQNGYTIAEDQSTAVVYGMPKAAIELGVVDKIVPITGVTAEILKVLS
ncbi:protein-glutamate methylesterase/protein-glutamine glutaminase [Sporomusa sphaeroides]|uniref:Protein-glutamate methylesterase/protein-glutamine glutaminase n=2 Tax=Sporomusa TaxID=2375 RepID=A0ABP2C5H3_9FIRM|nr:chemotaxis response regulator protein-glutamate methylesterase [Sporomusa sphaeroides]OLS58178.1 chemotaxis response regulator protein-glutamate methylesterase [Sporomusa sphaeroides DSM 2875]CVK17635.1 Chemotaxis response regulator protein-glutamate methylesterase [Sporomusa sphaeroides DSM 2875]SCM80442.1 fused chemotaxis regulator; protein-glutamate methylesterase in two-component regulatory system with CheA [uncultured Sporomusa sp.]